MEIDNRNKIAIVSALFGVIALCLAGGIVGKVGNLEECCDLTINDLQKITDCNLCVTAESCSKENAIAYEGCCYLIKKDNYLDIILPCVVLGCIIFTGFMGECLENCPACCQNCSACLVGFFNVIGLAMIGIFAAVRFAEEDGGEGSCNHTYAEVIDANGLVVSCSVFMIMGMLGSCVVACMSSSCCQPDDDGGETADDK